MNMPAMEDSLQFFHCSFRFSVATNLFSIFCSLATGGCNVKTSGVGSVLKSSTAISSGFDGCSNRAIGAVSKLMLASSVSGAGISGAASPGTLSAGEDGISGSGVAGRNSGTI